MATPIVDFGFINGAEIPPEYLRLGHPDYGKLGTALIAPSDLMANYSSRLMSLSVQRPSTRSVGPLIEYNAATATIELLNSDGALDPVNLSQPAPGIAVRIRHQHNGISYPIFSGFVTAWMPEHRAANHSVVVVNAVDGTDGLAGYERPALPPVGAGEDTGARINRILDSINWPDDRRDIAVGDSVVQETTLEGDALEEILAVAKSEIGEFYIDPQGKAFFRNRLALLTDDRSSTSQATFGSAPGEIRYVGTPGLSYDRDQLVNLMRATRVDGVTQIAEDGASRARYRDHAEEESDLLLTTDAAVLAWAKYVIRTDSTPELRFTSLVLDTRLDPDETTPQALGRKIGDRITVVRRPPGVEDSRDCFIRSIEHSWSPPDQWRTTWGLQSAEKFSFFVIGHPLQGRLGRNVLAY